MKQIQMITQIKTKIRVFLREYGRLCAAAAVVVLIMNYFCRTNDSDALRWILAPTAWWAGFLGRTYFEYLPHQGYVNHFHQFLIAPSCAGCRFMLITFLMLLFSFRPPAAIPMRGQGKTKGSKGSKGRRESLWLGFSIVFSYLSTVFVNGIRIVTAIYLPNILDRMHLMDGWLTFDRLHTLIGVVIYFTFLCLIYFIAIFVHEHIIGRMERTSSVPRSGAGLSYLVEQERWIAPMFWYFFIVLAVPFVKRLYYNEWQGFGQYALAIVGVCGSVCVLFRTVLKIRH